MSPLFVYFIGLACVALLLGCVWFSQLRTHNANVVDPVWTWSLGGMGILLGACGSGPVGLRMLMATGAILWAHRLASHLLRRNYGAPEDARYARYRKQWGANADRNLFWFIEFQVVFTALLSLPFIAIAWRDTWPPTWAVVVAVAVWLVSVVGEATSDAQLERFKADPTNKGKVNRDGLWRYSRHPNYFFECLHWFTYLFLAIGTSWWWLGLVPPAVMAFLLLKLSGIPMVEAHLTQSRPGYAEYIRTTSAFVPWPPKDGG